MVGTCRLLGAGQMERRCVRPSQNGHLGTENRLLASLPESERERLLPG